MHDRRDGGRQFGIVGRVDDMGDHGPGRVLQRHEGLEVGRDKCFAGGVDDRPLLVGIERRAAMAGNVLHDRHVAGLQQPVDHLAAERGDEIGIRAEGAGADDRARRLKDKVEYGRAAARK